MTVKEKILAIYTAVKAAFDAPPAGPTAVDPNAPPAAPAPTSAATVFSWPVDGGAVVYVDCSDDGLADIDPQDKVFSDPALTIPYPDGTYNVTGTDFGFTVAGGLVTAETDADGTGPGLPIEQAPPAAAAPAAPAPAGPTADQRIAALEAAVAKLAPPPVTTGMATEVQLQAATQMINKHETTITGLFTLIEALVQAPTSDPKTLTAAAKEKFDKANSKEAKLIATAAQIKKMREERNK